MPVITSAFTTADFQLRYRDPFITKSTNEKSAINVSRGIYRGFRLGPGSSNFEVRIRPDSPAVTGNTGFIDSFDDHVAVYQVGAGASASKQYSLSLRKTGGVFVMDLTDIADVTAVTAYITLFASYSYGSVSSAEMRAYTSTEWAALSTALKGELLVLGTCTIPPSGSPAPITVVNHDYRTSAWSTTAPEDVAWSPILKNPGFDYSVAASTASLGIAHWVNRNELAVNGGFRTGTATVLNGTHSLEFNKSAVGAGVGKIEQLIETPVIPGQVLRVKASVRQLIAPTAGTYSIKLNWGDATSAATTSSTVAVAVLSTTDASWRVVDGGVHVPDTAFKLKSVSIEVAGLTTGSTGVALVVDNFQVFVESGGAWNTLAAENARLRQELLSVLLLEDPATYTTGQLAGLLRFDRTTPASQGKVVIERKDQDYTGGNLPPALDATGRLMLGAKLLPSMATARDYPRISAEFYEGDAYALTLIHESVASGEVGGPYTIPPTRYYITAGGDLYITHNAKNANTSMAQSWVRDVAGLGAHAWVVRAAGMIQYHSPAVEATPFVFLNVLMTSGPKPTTPDAGFLALGASDFPVDLAILGGDLKHIERLHSFQPHLRIFNPSGTVTFVATTDNQIDMEMAASATVYIDIAGMRDGDRLIKVEFIGVGTGSAPTFGFYAVGGAGTEPHTLVNSGVFGVVHTFTMNPAVTTTNAINLKIVTGGASTFKIVGWITTYYDRPWVP